MNNKVDGFVMTQDQTLIHHSGFWEALYFGDPGQEDGPL